MYPGSKRMASQYLSVSGSSTYGGFLHLYSSHHCIIRALNVSLWVVIIWQTFVLCIHSGHWLGVVYRRWRWCALSNCNSLSLWTLGLCYLCNITVIRLVCLVSYTCKLLSLCIKSLSNHFRPYDFNGLSSIHTLYHQILISIMLFPCITTSLKGEGCCRLVFIPHWASFYVYVSHFILPFSLFLHPSLLLFVIVVYNISSYICFSCT
jgi:hypothetical protein